MKTSRNDPGSAAHHSATLHAALRPGHDYCFVFRPSERADTRPGYGHLPTPAGKPIFRRRIEPGLRSFAMDIQGLGYVGVRAKSLEDWAGFGTRFLGMQLVDRSAKTLALRMDDRKQRVVVTEDDGEGVAFFGWKSPTLPPSIVLPPGSSRRASRSRAARVRWPTSAG